MSNLSPHFGTGSGGVPLGPSSSPHHRDRNQPGRWGAAMNADSRHYGSLASPGRGVGSASSATAMTGAASFASNVGVGSWHNTRPGASLTPRSVSASAIPQSGSPRPMSHFMPRVIRPEGTSSTQAGLSATRPQSQRHESNSASSGVSVSRTRHSSSGRSGSVTRSQVHPPHSHPHSFSALHPRSSSHSTHSAPEEIYLIPPYIAYSSLRDNFHTIDTMEDLKEGSIRGGSLSRSVVTYSTPYRREFSPATESDDEVEVYGPGRLLRPVRDRGRTRDSSANHSTSHTAQQQSPNESILMLPSKWSDQDRDKLLSVRDGGRTITLDGV